MKNELTHSYLFVLNYLLFKRVGSASGHKFKRNMFATDEMSKILQR